MEPSASRSTSRPRPSSRPTTPLRPSSRSSFREAHGYGNSISNAGYTQPAINALEPQFAELADSMADLEANFMHLQLLHESLTRFSENFASFLYGLNMNAFCVDFPEAPIADSFRRAKEAEAQKEAENEPVRPTDDGEMTFLLDNGYIFRRTPTQYSLSQTDPQIFDKRYNSGNYTGYRSFWLGVIWTGFEIITLRGIAGPRSELPRQPTRIGPIWSRDTQFTSTHRVNTVH
ncbi:hypothetical protein N7478_012462 [Penicillium angulare]|uniref:uncharacterized protein n=1 Tax=Penicillium angulare TaxID=116970 RepID=UPI002541DDFD|nr:uncharacterized protein N7478_012462 [Penicillium angulare]KAJ5259481.1 hypothetical protein N7478_012462 [Penicillium angulare]